jgi:hypothetical protein
MERSSSQVIATNIAANDFRSAVGARWYNDMFWAGAYLLSLLATLHLAHSASTRGFFNQNRRSARYQLRFWDLGRFSVVYRKLFGGPPPETLRRPPPDRPFLGFARRLFN